MYSRQDIQDNIFSPVAESGGGTVKYPPVALDADNQPTAAKNFFLKLFFSDKKGNPLEVRAEMRQPDREPQVLENVPFVEISIVDMDPRLVSFTFKKDGFKDVAVTADDFLSLFSDSELSNGITVVMERGMGGIAPLLIASAGILFLVFRKKKKAVGKISAGDVTPFILIGGALLAFSAVNKLFTFLGIFRSKDTKNLDQEASNPNSPWSPNYWIVWKEKGVKWSYAIDEPTAYAWLEELRDAFGWFNDCEECAIAVLKRCRTKSNLSFLAWVFQKYWGEDLLTYLRGGWWPEDRLSDEDVNTIDKYISKLPNY